MRPMSINEWISFVKSEQNARFESAMNEDLGARELSESDAYEVYNFDSDTEYEVNLKYKTCTCMDFYNRCQELGIKCKHILYVEEALKHAESSDSIINKLLNIIA